MSIRLARFTCEIVEHPLRTDRIVVSAAGKHDSSRFILVTVEDDHGTCGYGEGATTTVWSGESAETAKWMVDHRLALKLTGITLDHPIEALDALGQTVAGNPFARAAVDTAVWDLWARCQDRSVSQLITERPLQEKLLTRASIGASDVPTTVRLARDFHQSGVRVLKFKVGVPGCDDHARLKAVRDELGPTPVFTVDANGGYATAEEALRAIDALLEFRITLVEQPTPSGRLTAMRDVKRRLSVPLMADESIWTPDQLDEGLELDAFDVLAVYPGKNGGFTRALQMARTVHRAGKSCAIGSNLESEIGLAAMGALAGSLPGFENTGAAGDFASSLYYKDVAICGPSRLERGYYRLPQGPGFGVIPKQKIERILSGPADRPDNAGAG
jgi:muconate cycloisomerase